MQNEPRLPRWPWVIGLMLLLATALGAGWFLNNSPAGGDVNYSEKDKSAVAPPITVCQGFVDTELGVAKLHPLVPGRVEAVVREGTEVKKGDVLLKLDRQIAENKLSEAAADLSAAQVMLQQAEKLPEQHRLKKDQQLSAVEAARQQREATNQEYQGKLKSFEQNGTIGIAFKLAQEALVRALDEKVKVEELRLKELTLFDSQPQADINRAKADVQAKSAKLHEAEFALRECTLVAPCDGSVLRVFTQPGESLGTTPTVPAIQFCPNGPKIIRAEVLQEWAYRVEPGQEVTIVDDTYAAATWQGRVKKVSEWFAEKRQKIYEPFMLNDVRTLECLIEVTSEGRPLRIGQRVRVRIQQKAS
jgi:multidrug resistance efflux pump